MNNLTFPVFGKLRCSHALYKASTIETTLSHLQYINNSKRKYHTMVQIICDFDKVLAFLNSGNLYRENLV